jgi:NitT/TauT family transport system substrate-binding protein
MTRKTAVTWGTAAIIMSLGAAACGNSSADSSGSDSGNVTSVTIRTGTPYIGTFAPLYLALQNGDFTRAHLHVTILGGTGTLPVVQSVAAGQTQVALVDTAATSELIDQGLHVKVIALPQPTSDMGVVSFSSAGITTPASLEGKHLAVTSTDAISALFPAFTAATHLDTSRITQDQVAVAEKATEVLQGKDNALLGYKDAQGAQLAVEAKKPTSTLLFSTYGIKITGYGIIANDAWLKQNPAAAKNLIGAIVKGFNQAISNPAAAVAAGASANPTFSKPVALAMLKAENSEIQAERTSGKPIGWMSQGAWTQSLNVLQRFAKLKNTSPSDYYTNQYLPAS